MTKAPDDEMSNSSHRRAILKEVGVLTYEVVPPVTQEDYICCGIARLLQPLKGGTAYQLLEEAEGKICSTLSDRVWGEINSGIAIVKKREQELGESMDSAACWRIIIDETAQRFGFKYLVEEALEISLADEIDAMAASLLVEIGFTKRLLDETRKLILDFQ